MVSICSGSPSLHSYTHFWVRLLDLAPTYFDLSSFPRGSTKHALGLVLAANKGRRVVGPARRDAGPEGTSSEKTDENNELKRASDVSDGHPR